MKISEKRKAGEILGRSGISQRIINLAKDISEGTYKNAINKGARIAELIQSATYDGYWHEKSLTGSRSETYLFECLNERIITRDKYITRKEKEFS